MALFNSLRCRPFAWLWGGQTISRLGDGLFTLALSWWVLEKTGSPAAMGLVQVFTILPKLVFLLIGGVIADRLPRLRVMLASDGSRGMLLAVVVVLVATQRLEVWMVYVAGLVFGFVDAFFQPAYTAVMPDVVPQELLPSANSLTALSGQFAGIFGPALGGLIVAAGGANGTALAFGLDGLSFFAAAVLVLPFMGQIIGPKPKTDAPPPNAVRELREGFAAIFSSAWLWLTIVLAAFANMFISGPISVSLPFLVKDTLHAGASALGVIFSVFSIGAIVGAVFIGRARKLHRRGLVTYVSFISAGLLIALVGLVPSVAGVALVGGITGMCLAIGQLIWTNVLQELVPGELLGRVSSVDQFGSFVLLPISYGLVGWLTQQFGAPLMFVLGGVVTSGIMALGLLHPAVRHLD